jgi:hypothetical protein
VDESITKTIPVTAERIPEEQGGFTASISGTCSTASRRPRMIGLPPKIAGFTVMRSRISFSFICPLPHSREQLCLLRLSPIYPARLPLAKRIPDLGVKKGGATGAVARGLPRCAGGSSQSALLGSPAVGAGSRLFMESIYNIKAGRAIRDKCLRLSPPRCRGTGAGSRRGGVRILSIVAEGLDADVAFGAGTGGEIRPGGAVGRNEAFSRVGHGCG